jgi:ribosome-binding protein aMBF1 (putative translation factor)
MPTAVKVRALSPARKDAVLGLLALSEAKERRVLELKSLYRKAVDDAEREEILSAIGEVIYRRKEDLAAESLEDKPSAERSNAKVRLAKHRKYVAKQIEKHRTSRNWTQEELSEKAGLPQSHVSRLERCVHAPTGLTIQKLADAFGISPGELDPSFD